MIETIIDALEIVGTTVINGQIILHRWHMVLTVINVVTFCMVFILFIERFKK